MCRRSWTRMFCKPARTRMRRRGCPKFVSGVPRFRPQMMDEVREYFRLFNREALLEQVLM